MFVILTILFAIATAVCTIGWIKHKVANNLLLKYMLYKGCNLPTEEDIEKCADMTVQDLINKKN